MNDELEVNHVQKYLQTRGLSFKKSVIEMRSLKGFLKDKRYLVEEALQFPKGTCEEMDISLIKRRTFRKKKIRLDEKGADEPLTFDQEVKR